MSLLVPQSLYVKSKYGTYEVWNGDVRYSNPSWLNSESTISSKVRSLGGTLSGVLLDIPLSAGWLLPTNSTLQATNIVYGKSIRL